MRKIILFIFLFFIFTTPVNAAILINEISPSTDTEWIELYNDSDTDFNLDGYLLEDGNASKTDDLKLTGTILSKNFLVFTHSEGWLNNNGDTLKLYNNASPSAIIDQYTFGNVDASKSIARIPNGSENWIITSDITYGSVNPTPSPSPTPSPTPTIQSTQTPTDTPKTSSPTPTKSPIPTSAPTKKPTITPSPTAISEEIFEPTATPEVLGISTEKLKTEASKPKIPIIPIVLIGSGIVLIVFAVIQFIRAAKQNNLQS